MDIKEFYHKNYKKILLIPLVLFIILLSVVIIKYEKTGELINKDVSLSGGISATVYTSQNIDVKALQSKLSSDLKEQIFIRPLRDYTTNENKGIAVEVSNTKINEELKTSLEKNLNIALTAENYSVEETGSNLGASFYKEMLIAIFVAFILMGIVVFITFRTFIPSIAVVFAALFDILAALAVIDFLDVRISTAGIAALLLVIGYSIDTDILLTTKLLKRREGELMDRAVDAIKTGLTMTLTTVAAVTAGYIFTNSLIFKQMFLIIAVALIFDIIATYLMNLGILLWYIERKK